MLLKKHLSRCGLVTHHDKVENVLFGGEPVSSHSNSVGLKGKTAIMEFLWSMLWWLYAFIFVVLFLSATVHHHLGLRKKYIEVLLKVFAFGQERVERKRLSAISTLPDDGETPMEEISHPLFTPNHPKALGLSEDIKEDFHLSHMMDYLSAGMASITDDTVTKYFEPEELPQWNLLSRTNNRAYEFVSFRLTVFWVLGFFVRYLILFPLRIIILILGFLNLCVCMSLVGMFPDGVIKRWLNKKLTVFCFDFVAGSLSLVATFHNLENAPKGGGIAVANHTSPIDALVLATHQCYDMVGQKHSGIMGLFTNSLSKASSHIWFERSEAKQRALVMDRLVEHANNPDLPPILIFPEGVCVNNTSVMQFKKGAFEIDTVIYPIAIRFDARFGDAFWWQDKFDHYLLYMMTSWAIVCNIWYLPPMRRRLDESAIAFADRVKAKIAQQGGMIDLSWDGFLKTIPVKAEWKKQQQEEYAKHINITENNSIISDSNEEENETENMEEIEKVRFDDKPMSKEGMNAILSESGKEKEE